MGRVGALAVRGGLFVFGGVCKISEGEGFFAFDAGAAFAAMEVVAFVAGPSVGEVDVEIATNGGDVFFANVDEGAQHLDVGVGAGGNGLRHGGEEVFAAVGVDGVVTGVGGDDEAFGADTFGKAGGDGKKDAVAEGDDGALHVFLLVVAFGDVSAGLKEVTFEESVHKGEVSGVEGNSGLVGLPSGHGEFFGVVFGGVVDAEAGDHFVLGGEGMPESDGGIHATGKKNDRFHGVNLQAGREKATCLRDEMVTRR